MITRSLFLQCIQENVNRVTHYELGGDGSDGKCDCIGLIIGAVRLAGGTWNGTHGSNWAARNAMDGLSSIGRAADCFLGEIVYKAKEPGEEGYDLPSSYKNSPDQRDYYHVGVVTSVDPLCITHCTGVQGGIKCDSTLGKWRYGGRLKYVDYDAGGESMDEDPLYIAIVTAKSGNTVRMRSGPSDKSDVLENIKVGTEVDVLEILNGWNRIRHNGVSGYMMSKFLEPVGGTVDEEAPPMGGTVTVSKAALKAARSALMLAVESIDDVLNGE